MSFIAFLLRLFRLRLPKKADIGICVIIGGMLTIVAGVSFIPTVLTFTKGILAIVYFVSVPVVGVLIMVYGMFLGAKREKGDSEN